MFQKDINLKSSKEVFATYKNLGLNNGKNKKNIPSVYIKTYSIYSLFLLESTSFKLHEPRVILKTPKATDKQTNRHRHRLTILRI